ncbi:MAG: HlyD family secretion protein, partial [Armatimonadota bacterium]
GPRTQTVDAARARVEQARGALNTAQSSKGQTKIFAPADGRVTVRNAEPGELVTPGMPIVRVAQLQNVWLRVYVPEPQIGKLRLGQQADVTTDSSARKYSGRVTDIAEEPEFTPKNVQTKDERMKLVFGVKIAVENPDGSLKPGMPADAVIHVGD